MESQYWRFGECVRGKWGDWDPKSKSFRRELKYVLSWNLLQRGGGGGGIMNILWDEHGYPLKQEKHKVQSL